MEAMTNNKSVMQEGSDGQQKQKINQRKITT
jgi:hypothetical protein